MSLLRIRGSLGHAPQRCQWALVKAGSEPTVGEGSLAQLPDRAERVQLVLPAAQVLITRARLPQAARRHAGSVLAFAVEDETVGEPEAGQVGWLGAVEDATGKSDVLAVLDKAGLKRWLDALEAAGIRAAEVHCEALLLPWTAGEWSLAWDGREGVVRTGRLEGAATDSGDRNLPPLALRLMLDEAQARGEKPASIALFLVVPASAPDLDAWQRELGIALRLAGSWDWRTASPLAGVNLAPQRRRWRMAPGLFARLRPAAWIAGVALTLMAAGQVADWTRLAREQQALRRNMAERFRTTFPDAVMVDPALQMRRKLAEARHAAGQSDRSDFLPMIEQVAAAAKELPAGALRTVSYEGGRMTLELAAVDEAGLRRIVARLLQSGLSVDMPSASSSTPARAASATVVLTVRAS